MASIIIYNFLFIAFYTLSFLMDISVFGYAVDAPFINRVTYMFCHRSFLHFAVSMFAFNYMAYYLRRDRQEWVIPIATIVAVLATFFSEQVAPTIGSSGMLYAMCGYALTLSIYIFGFTPNNIFALASLIGINILYLILDRPINTMLHALSYVYASLLTITYILWKRHQKS